MRTTVIRIFTIALIIATCALIFAGDTFAQCAMCRSSVPQAVAKNLNVAIVVLLAPPVTLFTAIFFIAFRNRKG